MQSLDMPRALRRAAAARYIGVSPRTFDKLRRERRVPLPKDLFGVTVWDRDDLDYFVRNRPAIEG